MTPNEFVEWLDRYIKTHEITSFTKGQVKELRQKLDSVFTKVTPDRSAEPEAPEPLVPNKNAEAIKYIEEHMGPILLCQPNQSELIC